jgi:crotonobetaine/carnitine-CoA ligase
VSVPSELSPRAVLARYGAHDDTVPGLLASRAATRAVCPALRFEQREHTYAEVAESTRLLANWLARQGVVAGSPVAFVAPNSDLCVLAFLACAHLGALFVPTNPALTDTELTYVLRHCRASHVIAPDASLARLSALCVTAPVLLALEMLGGSEHSAADVSARLRELAGTDADAHGVVTPATPLVVVYTSGTTGFPKGVVHSHRNYVWAAEAFVERMHLQPDERLLTVLPFFHINALFYSLGGALAAGACLITTAGFSASRFWDYAAEVGATQFNTLAAVGSILCRRPRSEFNPGHRIRKVYGGPISADMETTFRDAFGVPVLIEGYGMSEIPGACNNPYAGPHKTGSIGVPARHPRFSEAFVAMRVVDDSGREVPREAIGELEVRTPIAFLGYLHDLEQTAAAHRDGWFCTGDLVRQAADGYFYFIARKKDIIRVRGENVAGAELDRVLAAHPGISEAATIGVPAELGDEDILAVLVSRAEPPTIPELVAWCGAQLTPIKIPRYWVFVDELPHTPSHRVAKHKLKSDAKLRARAQETVR